MLGLAGDVIQLIHSSSFNVTLAFPFLLLPSREHPFCPTPAISSPRPARLSHFVTLYRSISALFFFPRRPFLYHFKTNRVVPGLATVLLTRFSRLLLSFPPSPCLPTRLVITSGAEELMAHFRKKKKKNEGGVERGERSRSPFIRSTNQIPDERQTLSFLQQPIQMCICLHQCR